MLFTKKYIFREQGGLGHRELVSKKRPSQSAQNRKWRRMKGILFCKKKCSESKKEKNEGYSFL
jgi:hypothetical protein